MPSVSTPVKSLPVSVANIQSVLTLCTLLTISRTVTVVSLRLLAKILCDLADRLEVNKSPTEAALWPESASAPSSHQDEDKEFVAPAEGGPGGDRFDAAPSDGTPDPCLLEERYNQLLQDTRLSLVGLKRHRQPAVDSDVNSMFAHTGDGGKFLVVEEDPAEEKKRRPRTDSTDSGAADLDYVDLDPDTGLEVVSLAEVADHCTPDDAWTVIYDRVYDVTDYLVLHPGGEEVLMEYVGYDATVAFRGVAHSRAAFRALEKYCVGILPDHERLNYSPL